MDFPTDMLEPALAPKVLAERCRLPHEVFAGKEDFLVVLGSETEVEALSPDFRLLRPGERTRRHRHSPKRLRRFRLPLFLPNAGIDEDR